MGYGSWGSVNLVPTLGYGIGVSSPVTLVGNWSDIERISANRSKAVIKANRIRINIAANRQRSEVRG